MKTAKLEIHNTKGEVIHEDQIVIEEGDKLIVTVPDNATRRTIDQVYSNVKKIMENELVNTLIIPESVKLKVLKVK